MLQKVWAMLGVGTATLINNSMLEYFATTSNPLKQKMQSLFSLLLFILGPVTLIFKFNLTYVWKLPDCLSQKLQLAAPVSAMTECRVDYLCRTKYKAAPLMRPGIEVVPRQLPKSFTFNHSIGQESVKGVNSATCLLGNEKLPSSIIVTLQGWVKPGV